MKPKFPKSSLFAAARSLVGERVCLLARFPPYVLDAAAACSLSATADTAVTASAVDRNLKCNKRLNESV